jgi:DNA invertase Pin-like site-specific DNA recombinase
MSTDKQDASIPEQRKAVHELAVKEGYEILREYSDHGISGDATEKRQGFLAMSRDATEKRDFPVVLCWDQDRFGRFDPLDAGYWIKPFRDAGVRLETCAQGKIDWESFAGQVQYAVNQGAKRQFLSDHSRNILRGLREAALRGQWLGGKAPYAYQVVTVGKEGKKDIKKLKPGEPLQIDVVRWLYQTYADKDVSLRWLADELHRRGVRSPRGQALWSRRTVRKILTNRAYVGDFVWNQECQGSYHAIKGGEIQPRNKRLDKRQRTAPEEWVIVEQAHEAIIDRELWERVQAKLHDNRGKTTPNARRGDWLLSGLVVCGHCGHRMRGDVRGRPGQRRRRIYRCATSVEYGSGACHTHGIDAETLGRCVLGKLQDALLKPATLAQLRAELQRQAETPWQQDLNVARQLREQLRELGEQIDRGSRNLTLADADLLPVIGEQVRRLQSERRRLEGQLVVAERPPDHADLKARIAQAEQLVFHFEELFKEADQAQLRTLLHQIIDRIELHWECGSQGKQRRCHFQAGAIFVRADVQWGLGTFGTTTAWRPRSCFSPSTKPSRM